ncbi:Pyruvate/Phosphoenolpyruvate kinase-like domain-containing protein [Mycena olivaceomarginata]|nr:Pyruvate/Phosphoenolpyruvate kinase-like domain-containing protein [Mycena olivaceomarginata]
MGPQAWRLDAGAGGIIVPHMETVEEMKAVIAACRFPPIGHRSFPPFTFIPGVTDITPEGESVFSIANKHSVIVPQIESRVGMQKLDAILSMGEISAFMLGLGDLRLDMGLPLAMDGDEPELVEALRKATKLSKAHDIPLLGGGLSKDMVKQRVDEGYRLILCGFDMHALAFGTRTTLAEAREIVEERMQSLHSA